MKDLTDEKAEGFLAGYDSGWEDAKHKNHDGKHEVQVQHKWLWAISPLDSNYDIAFVAHCRMCNLAYTQRLYVMDHGGSQAQLQLPEWGCRNPMAEL